MKRLFAFAFVLPLAALLLLPRPAFAGGDAAGETQLIGVLQNGVSAADKAEACARLKWIGTAASVPALAQLLTDKELAHSARYALESMQCREAGDALRAALARTTGSNKVGLINSLSVRREKAAVPDLAGLLSDPDPEVAMAAARALGKIGGKEATDALVAAWQPGGSGHIHDAQCDGLLAAANGFLTAGEKGQAEKLFEVLHSNEKDDAIRLAAFRGLILSSDKKGIAMMVKAIKDGAGPDSGAALQLASRTGGTAVTRALGEMLRQLPVAGQIAVLQALQERGDRAARLYVADRLNSDDADVRIAAITALGDLGDDTDILPLAHTAATATGAEKAAARQALVDLRHGNMADGFAQALPKASPEAQAELIRAMSERGDSYAAPKLMELAQKGDDSLRSAALQGLAELGGPAEFPGLIQLIVNAPNDDIRSAAADTLSSVCQHVQIQGKQVDAAALARAASSGPKEARLALLGVCSGVVDPRIREVLRATVADPDPDLRAAGIRALCDSQDEELLPDILNVAAREKAINFRMLAIRGTIRLVTQDQGAPVPVAQKIEALKSVLPDTFNAEGKRLVLSGLATIPDPQALTLAESLRGEADVKLEADDATVQIARAIAPRHPETAAAALHRVLSGGPDPSVRKSAQAALRQIKAVN